MNDDPETKRIMKKIDRDMNKHYKDKLVNLYTEKPIQFDSKTVYKTMEKLNSGKEVSKKTLVKMLYQLHYMILEYQSLVNGMNCISRDAKRYADSHVKIAYPEQKNRRATKKGD